MTQAAEPPGRPRQAVPLGHLLARDAALYGLGHIIARSTYLVLVPVLTRTLLPQELGSVDLLMVTTMVAISVVGLEIGQALARHIPSASANARREMASSALRFATLVFGLAGLVGIVFAEPLAAIVLGAPAQAPMVRAAAIYAATSGVFLVAHGQLRFELRPGSFALVAVTVAFASFLSVVLLVTVLHMGAGGVFLGNAIGAATALTLAVWLARDSFRGGLSSAALLKLLRFSAPLVPATLATFTTTYSDRFVISRILGNAEVGLYAVGYRLASIVSVATVAFQLALGPLIYSRYERSTTPSELAAVFRVVAAGATLVWLTLSLFSNELIAILATQEYAASSTVIPALAGALLISGMLIFAPGLFIAGRTGTFALLAILTATSALLLNVLLVPVLGIQGSAAAALASALAAFGATMLVSQRYYPIPYRWWETAAIVGSAVAVWLGASSVPIDGWPGIAFRGVTIILLAAGYLATGVLRPRVLIPAGHRPSTVE